MFILSCDVYVASRIITIHLEGNRYLYISTRAFKVCQVCVECWIGNVLLVSTKTAHKSISTPLWIFSIAFMASELLTTYLSGQEMHLSTFLAVSQVTGNSISVRITSISTGRDTGINTCPDTYNNVAFFNWIPPRVTFCTPVLLLQQYFQSAVSSPPAAADFSLVMVFAKNLLKTLLFVTHQLRNKCKLRCLLICLNVL